MGRLSKIPNYGSEVPSYLGITEEGRSSGGSEFLQDNGEAPKKANYCLRRLLFGIVVATFVIICLTSLAMQFASVGGVYNVQLGTFCEAYSGSVEIRSNFTGLPHVLIDGPDEAFCAYAPGTSGTPYWEMPESFRSSYLLSHVNCGERVAVVRNFLSQHPELLKGPADDLTEALSTASLKANVDCLARTTSVLFLQSIAPVLSTLSYLLFFWSSWRRRRVSVYLALIMAAISACIGLVAIWTSTSQGARELISNFATCSGSSTALQSSTQPGTLWNGQPCLDVNTAGEEKLNPFVRYIVEADAGYFTGGSLNVLAMFIVIIQTSRAVASLSYIRR